MFHRTKFPISRGNAKFTDYRNRFICRSPFRANSKTLENLFYWENRSS
jgi:hypothetical protein